MKWLHGLLAVSALVGGPAVAHPANGRTDESVSDNALDNRQVSSALRNGLEQRMFSKHRYTSYQPIVYTSVSTVTSPISTTETDTITQFTTLISTSTVEVTSVTTTTPTLSTQTSTSTSTATFTTTTTTSTSSTQTSTSTSTRTMTSTSTSTLAPVSSNATSTLALNLTSTIQITSTMVSTSTLPAANTTSAAAVATVTSETVVAATTSVTAAANVLARQATTTVTAAANTVTVTTTNSSSAAAVTTTTQVVSNTTTTTTMTQTNASTTAAATTASATAAATTTGVQDPVTVQTCAPLSSNYSLFHLRSHVIYGNAIFEDLYVQSVSPDASTVVPTFAANRTNALGAYYDVSTSSIAIYGPDCPNQAISLESEQDFDPASPVFITQGVGTARMSIANGELVWENDQWGSWLACNVNGAYDLEWWDVETDQRVNSTTCAKVQLLTEYYV